MNWADYLDWNAREHPGKPLVHCEGVVTTHGEMRRWANRVGNALAGLGVRKGDRVATYLPTTARHEAVLIGAVKLGAIGCPLSLREKPATMIGALGELDAAVLVVGHEHAEFARLARSSAPALRVVSAGGALDDVASLDDLEAGSSEELETVPMRETDVAFIGFTAGTTRKPKGVPVTARMLRAHDYAVFERFKLRRGSETLFGLVSFGHVGGLAIGMAPAYTVGATHVLLPRWDPAEAVRLVVRHQVSCLIGSNTHFQQMARTPEFASADFSSLRVTLGGGEPTPQRLKDLWLRGTGARLCEAFGMSESTVLVTLEDPRDPVSSSGRPFERVNETRIVDPVTRQVIEGAGTGEVAVRGALVTPGYWRDPEQTRRRFDADGWFYTGDLCRRDEDGHYYTVGRGDDMFQSGGENVYPAEVEATLAEHPDVVKAFCFPETHPEWGKVPTAVVELRAGALTTTDELLEFCASHATLARFKRPRRILRVDGFPLGPTGKVVRRDLKSRLAEMGHAVEL